MLEKLFTAFADETNCVKRKVAFEVLSNYMISQNKTWEDIKNEEFKKNYFKDELQILAFNWQTYKAHQKEKESHKKILIDFLKKNDLSVHTVKSEDYSCCFPAADFKQLSFDLSQAKNNLAKSF
jgi:hypothetical protein